MSRAFLLITVLLLGPNPCTYGAERSVDKQSIRVWMNWMLEEMPGKMAAMARFMEDNPDIRIEFSRIVGEAHYNPQDQKLMCAIAGGDPPEVVLQDRFSIGGWAARGAFEPLDEFIERDWKAGAIYAVTGSHYYPACWQEAAYEGNVYGIPFGTDARAMFWNKDLIEAAAGSSDWKLYDEKGNPRPPATWEEMRSHNPLLIRKDAKGNLVSVGYLPDQGNCYLYMYGWQNGGSFMDLVNHRCTLNDPKIVEALEYMCGLYAPYAPDGQDRVAGRIRARRFVEAFQGGVSHPFLEGQMAVWIDVDNFFSRIGRYKPDMRLGVIPVPYPEGKEPITWSGGFAFVIPRGVDPAKAELAWRFIKWMVSPEAHFLMCRYQNDYNRSKGRLAVPSMSANRVANEAVYDQIVVKDPDLPANIKEELRKFYDLLPRSRFRPVTPVGQFLWNKQYDAVDQASFGNGTPQEILDRFTNEVNAEIARIEEEKPPLDQRKVWVGVIVALALLLVYLLIALRRHGPMGRGSREEMVWGYLFLSPWLAGFILLMVGPIVASFILSFTEYDVIHPPKWVGLKNYRELTGLAVEVTSWAPWEWKWEASDPLFWRSVWNTAFMLLSIPLTMALGLAIALLLQREIRGMASYRTLFYLPAIVPFVASSVLWMSVLRPEGGLLNSVLETVLPIEGPAWLAGQGTAKPAIILMLLWASGSAMIVWLAGLKGIGAHYYESAEIDGAGFFRKLFFITLPLLSPYILYNLIMGTIGVIQIFTQAMVMTYGGPANSTLFYAYYLFQNAFYYFRMGIASAMAWMLFLATLILTLIQLRSSRNWVYYEGEET